MSSIADKQNSAEALELLASQRYLYSIAKRYFNIRVCDALIVAIVFPLLILYFPSSKPFLLVLSVIVFVADFVLNSLQTKDCLMAAKIQELFDTNVLSIAWNDISVGGKPDWECIRENSRQYEKKYGADRSKLKNWYSIEVDGVDPDLATILCQRSNINWDSSLRKKYVVLLIVVAAVVITIIVVQSLEIKVAQFIERIIPWLPIFKILHEQISSQIKTIRMLNRLRVIAEQVTNEAISRQKDIQFRIRLLQNEIFIHRKSCPLVPDWLYRLFRTKNEDVMNYSVAKSVEEIRKPNAI